MKIGKLRHLKISEAFEKIKNENSRGLGRCYKRRKYVLRSQDILYGGKHPKGRKNGDLCIRTHSQAPRALLNAVQNCFLLLFSGKRHGF